MERIHERIKQIASRDFSLKKILDYAEKVMDFDLTAGEFKILLAVLDDQHIQNVIDLNEKIKPLKDALGQKGMEDVLLMLDRFKTALKKSHIMKP